MASSASSSAAKKPPLHSDSTINASIVETITNNNATTVEDAFMSFQELIGDALNSSTVAATKMIQVMAEVFTQQQQILNLQIENQEMLKETQELLKTVNSTQQQLLSREPQLPSKELQLQMVQPEKRVTMEPERRVTINLPKEVAPLIKLESPKRSVSPSLKCRRGRSQPAPKKTKFLNTALNMQLSALVEALIEYKDSEGRQVSDDFISLPTKRELPQYYKQISNPMDFSRIRRNLKHGLYDTIDALGSDIKLLCINCQKFNRDDSDIFRDSETLLAIWERLKASATALV
jgi:hypothetical protein